MTSIILFAIIVLMLVGCAIVFVCEVLPWVISWIKVGLANLTPTHRRYVKTQRELRRRQELFKIADEYSARILSADSLEEASRLKEEAHLLLSK